jgi:hypothetical protein
LDACLGDLLQWQHRPQRDDALRAYIIKSRVRDCQKILLAQGYSPMLFRQGVLPGPDLLLKVLRGDISTKEATKKWIEIEKEKEASTRTDEHKDWTSRLLVPCRACTDRSNGQEVTKRLSEFTHPRGPDEIWKKVICKGQDLACLNCQHIHLKWELSSEVIPCDKCGLTKCRRDFDQDTLRKWEELSKDPFKCKTCQGQKRSTTEHIRCYGECLKEVPDHWFLPNEIADLQKRNLMVQAKCARCKVRAPNFEGPGKALEPFKCQGCEKSMAIKDFAPVAIKQWLSGERRSHIWKCYDCLHPACASSSCAMSNPRPLEPVPHNAWIGGRYYCQDCKYPLCSKCQKVRRSTLDTHSLKAAASYTCPNCDKNNDEKWEANFSAWKIYRQTNTNDPPRSMQVGRWVSKQRQNQEHMKVHCPTRYDKLDKDPQWTWKDKRGRRTQK